MRAVCSVPEFVEEVEQRLWDMALIGSAAAAPKLESYSGRGPLSGWLCVASQRIALMLQRRAAAERRALNGVASEARLVPRDPELAFIAQHLRDRFQGAIARALHVLDDRERMVYRLHVLDEVGVERLGAMYGVAHSTVSRWLARARAAIIAEAQRILREEMRISSEEFQSLSRILANDLDVSISGVLDDVA